MKQCVMMKHGLILYGDMKFGVCCLNGKSSPMGSSYDIDPINCKPCLELESSGIQSYRQGANAIHGLDIPHTSPIVLDIIPIRTCNLTCKICNASASSSWATLTGATVDKSLNISPSRAMELLEDIDLSHVREISFTGGEPLLNDKIFKYIIGLEDRIDFSKCILRFCTNGTFELSSNVRSLFEMFRLVQPKFSLDDICEGHEYQRYPSKWDEWLINWQNFLNTMPVNVMPAINRAIGILNINRVHMLDEWIKDYSYTRVGDKIDLLNNFVHGNYDLNYSTSRLKQHIFETYGENSVNWQCIKNFSENNDTTHLRSIITYHDSLHGTSLKEFDLDLYNIIFK